MKILNTYKQGNITWFEHKYLLGITKKLNIFKDSIEGELSKWLNSSELGITKRTKDTV